MSRTDDPTSDPNPPTSPTDDTREDVDEMDDRVFGGKDEQERQDNERPAASGSGGDVADAGPGSGQRGRQPDGGRGPEQLKHVPPVASDTRAGRRSNRSSVEPAAGRTSRRFVWAAVPLARERAAHR